ncbi:pilin [Undibacterium flavidum]|uniref:Prepilin-type N-terminal cleavage/methylation domain-containing protein n=1 Tax=Undibacterium flavidum TaxID=2762297 RepID=A0ABR6Y8K2_9BURK|nr:prepilin-type N-terminal cleavage/methylation domain-containing protein [Undibacterium flavidum]MBC3872935.1 prepilin-type N-terminal cleavage/methylation domain-containing protein [Undibacterium flavidum]
MRSNRIGQGFSLIEMMITVAIIGILAAVAMPAYQAYAKRSKFAEIVVATSATKIAVEICAQEQDGLTNCSGGLNGVPSDVTSTTGYLGTVITAGGRITATARAYQGLSGTENVIYVGVYGADKRVTWSIDATSTCKTATPKLC